MFLVSSSNKSCFRGFWMCFWVGIETKSKKDGMGMMLGLGRRRRLKKNRVEVTWDST